MSGSDVAPLLGLVLALLLLVALAGLLVRRLRRQASRAGRALGEELEGLTVLRGPESAEYAGGTDDVLRDRARGVLVLSAERLLFRDLSGAAIDVDLTDAEVSVEESFEGMRRTRDKGAMHLVVRRERSAVGFAVAEPEQWRRDVAARTGPGGG